MFAAVTPQQLAVGGLLVQSVKTGRCVAPAKCFENHSYGMPVSHTAVATPAVCCCLKKGTQAAKGGSAVCACLWLLKQFGGVWLWVGTHTDTRVALLWEDGTMP
jgi:hypothetical protein